MKHYSVRSELRFAMEDAAKGEQALFTYIWAYDKGPQCFRGTKTIGKLFDQDTTRLCETARALGADPIIVCRPGERGQHIDLVDTPLRRALKMSQDAG